MTGSGTALDPYIISDVTDLQNIENDLDAYYELANNIDASATSTWNGGAGFDPISYFEGTLDGKGFTISGLFINRPAESGVGLFSYIGNANALVFDIVMTGADITGNYNVGGLVGYGYLGTIRDCHVAGSVTSSHSFGSTGGLVGDQESGCIILDSSSSATVIASGDSIGGLVGLSKGDIEDSYATGNVTVTGNNDYIGGFIGQNATGLTKGCYATGNVSAVDCRAVGGFVGVQGSSESILDCYARGSVTGDDDVGGFVGDNRGTCQNCFSTGLVTGNTDAGGFCGYTPDDPIIDCFWDIQTSGQATSDGGTGKTTAQMKQLTTFINGGWTITPVTINRNNGYPFLGWEIGLSTIWAIYQRGSIATPRFYPAVEKKPTLELIRNLEMSVKGQVFVDKEGNFRYESRYGRHL